MCSLLFYRVQTKPFCKCIWHFISYNSVEIVKKIETVQQPKAISIDSPGRAVWK